MNFTFRVYFSDIDSSKLSGVNVAMSLNILLFVFSGTDEAHSFIGRLARSLNIGFATIGTFNIIYLESPRLIC